MKEFDIGIKRAIVRTRLSTDSPEQFKAEEARVNKLKTQYELDRVKEAAKDLPFGYLCLKAHDQNNVYWAWVKDKPDRNMNGLYSSDRVQHFQDQELIQFWNIMNKHSCLQNVAKELADQANHLKLCFECK